MISLVIWVLIAHVIAFWALWLWQVRVNERLRADLRRAHKTLREIHAEAAAEARRIKGAS